MKVEKSEKMRGMCGETCDWDRERDMYLLFSYWKMSKDLAMVFLLKDVNASDWERGKRVERKKVKNAAVSMSEKIRKHLLFLDSFIWSHSFYII